MSLNVLAEFEEFRPHLKSLTPLTADNTLIHIVTKEDIDLRVRWTAAGLVIESASVTMQKNAYDDLNQVLTEVSALYRNSFMTSLFARLSQEGS